MIVRYLIILLQVSHSDFSSLCIESLGTYIACYHDRYFLSVCDCHLSSDMGQSFLWVPAIRSWSAPGEPSYGAAIPMLQLLPSLSWPVWFTMCIEVLHSNRIKYSLRINFSALLIRLQVFGGLTFLRGQIVLFFCDLQVYWNCRAHISLLHLSRRLQYFQSTRNICECLKINMFLK